MANSLGSLVIDIKSDTTQLIQGFNRAEQAVSKTTKQMSYAVKGLIGAFVGLNTLDIARNFTKQLDLITSANNKLKLVTKTTEEYTNAQKELFRVAQITSSGYSESVSLYSKLSDSMSKMGKSQSDIIRTVETVNKAIAISGSTAEEANSAILQLGQAFGSGKLQGDELKSISENAQGLAKAIAEGMGVAVGDLKQLGADGKITSEVLANALAKVSSSVDSNYSQMDKTISQSSQNISNSIQKIIGDFDKISGASKGISTIFSDISKYLDTIDESKIQAISDTAETIGKVALSAGALAVGIKAYNVAVQVATTYNALFAGSYGVVNSAIVLATASQVAFNKVLKLSALGIAVTAIYGLSESFIEAKTRSDNLGMSVEQLANNFDVLALKARLADVNKELKAMDENIKGYNDTQKMMYAGGYDLAFKEKTQLEKSIELINKKNDALKNGKKSDTNILSPLSDEVKKIIAPIDVIKEKYSKYYEELKKAGQDSAKNKALLDKEMNDDIAKLDKEANQKAKEAEKEKQKLAKETAEVEADFALIGLDKNKEKFVKLDNEYKADLIKYKDVVGAKEKLDLVYADKRLELEQSQTFEAEQKKLDVKQLQIDTIENEFTKERELAKFKEDSAVLQLQRQLQLKEITQSQYDQSKIYLDEIYKKTLEQIDIDEKLQKEFDFKINLDVNDSAINDVQKSMMALSEEQKKYNKYVIKNGKDKDLIAKADIAHNENLIAGYSNLAGSLAGMFDKSSKASEDLIRIQSALALVNGVNAVVTAAAAPPPIGFASMAAMAGAVASVLGNAKIAFGGIGGSKTTTTSDSFSAQTANTGTNTILGDSKKASDSITKALGTLKDFAQPQYQVLESMNNYLATIANNIAGVSSILVRNAGYALGQGFTNTDTGFSNNISSFGLDKINLFDKLTGTNLMGGIINSVVGGLFGKSSVSQSITDSGIAFADTLLSSAIKEFNGQAYQTISTTVNKKSWFSSSSSTSISSYFEDLNTEVESQFSLVLSGLYNTVLESGKALDLSSSNLQNSLNSFVVSIGKISLKDKSGTEIQDLLTNVFSQIGDDLTKNTIPDLQGFQQVGEGLFNTLTRVATGIQEASFYTDRLGLSVVKYSDIINKQGVVGFEALSQSLIKVDEATYGANNGVVQMIDNMNATSEQLYNAYLSFGNIRDILEATNQSASNLSSSMVTGAGSISALESGTKSYMENFLSDAERLNIQLSNLSDEFKIAGYEMPKTRQGFINLINSIDTSTEKGAKSYGRLIALSDNYNTTISEIEDNLTNLVDKLSSLFKGLSDSVAQTIATLAGSTTDSQSATQQIKSFWEKRKEIDSLLALNGNLTDAQQSKLSTLVGEVNSLATNIQGQNTSSSNISSQLISSLTGLENSLNLENQILSVNIVGIASNVALVDNIAGITATVPTLTSNVSNYATTENLSNDIKDILTTIKNNLSTYPQKTYDILDDVINGNFRVKVQTN